MNIKDYTIEQLKKLSQEIREKILQTVSQNGGHLSSTLGATDLIVTMHHLFDSTKDPFIFDVSHQSYAHKLLTDRWEEFDTLRQFGGISGYTKPKESVHDYYVSGHSSTSISLAVGAAKAIRLKGEEEKRVPVALIGDGSMSAGMVYEALNELGDRKYPAVIILNDNEMSIAKPIGAVSKYLSQSMASPFYQKLKRRTEKILEHLPEGATYMAKRFEESFKLITPGILFEELGIEYIGPVNGHDFEALIKALSIAKNLKKPVIVHAQTTKGKGYEIAQGQKEHWHGVSPFDQKSGKSLKKSSKPSATSIFGNKLLALAKDNEKIVGVTAAMPSGTGMNIPMEAFPQRFWDVAIAEQHAVTSVGALAKEGFKPFCALYSTFLQRGYDQIIHDICLMDVPVVFAIDRAGIVGEDGETHQGTFDISYLRAIPNMTLLAPYNESTFNLAMEFATGYTHPCAIRYPRGAFLASNRDEKPFELGRGEIVQEGNQDVALIGYGNGVGRAINTARHLKFKPTVVDLRFVKPLDIELLKELGREHKRWFIFSDSAKIGGVGSAILEAINEHRIKGVEVVTFEYGDEFITHGNTTLVEESLGILPNQLARRIEEQI
ncbi:MAG: 1-deoxy-D-xylulose-5-phosphate synthase [Campylobacterota bacterium]|nr:1-deoxy-D-xylulose-5-phosphate synthase [Campylobacterota bacterium]